MSHLINKRN